MYEKPLSTKRNSTSIPKSSADGTDPSNNLFEASFNEVIPINRVKEPVKSPSDSPPATNVPSNSHSVTSPSNTFSSYTSSRSPNPFISQINHQPSHTTNSFPKTPFQTSYRTSQPSYETPTTTAVLPQPQSRLPLAQARVLAWFCCRCTAGPYIFTPSLMCERCNHARDRGCEVREVPKDSKFALGLPSPTAFMSSFGYI